MPGDTLFGQIENSFDEVVLLGREFHAFTFDQLQSDGNAILRGLYDLFYRPMRGLFKEGKPGFKKHELLIINGISEFST